MRRYEKVSNMVERARASASRRASRGAPRSASKGASRRKSEKVRKDMKRTEKV